jgi:hypothetical protein
MRRRRWRRRLLAVLGLAAARRGAIALARLREPVPPIGWAQPIGDIANAALTYDDAAALQPEGPVPLDVVVGRWRGDWPPSWGAL